MEDAEGTWQVFSSQMSAIHPHSYVKRAPNTGINVLSRRRVGASVGNERPEPGTDVAKANLDTCERDLAHLLEPLCPLFVCVESLTGILLFFIARARSLIAPL